jgi:hypothetical protein
MTTIDHVARASKLLGLLAGVAMLSGAGAAWADTAVPTEVAQSEVAIAERMGASKGVVLTDTQMDNVKGEAVSKEQAKRHDLIYGQAKQEKNLGQAKQCDKCTR